MDDLIPYTVFYIDTSEGPFWQFFECQAEDPDHAEEQCLNAYSGNTVSIVWVNEGHGPDSRIMQGLED